MRRKMALLLAFVMVVTTFVSVPFASYAADNTIPAITAVENEVKATPIITADGKEYTATYKYKANWKSKVRLYADNKEGAVKTITVTDSKGTPLSGDASATDTYTLVKGTTYTIKLKYVYEVAPTDGLSEVSLKTKAVSSTLTPTLEQPATSSMNAKDQELWYTVSVNSKGTVFSLDTTDNTVHDVGYSAYIYDEASLKGDKTPLGVSTWDAECEMMFECPLVLTTGTYYVKVCPNKSTGKEASFKLTVTADKAEQIDISPVNPPTLLVIGNNPYSYDLYSYLDRETGDNFAYWFKIAPTATGKYELCLDFEDSIYGDLGVGLIDLKRDFRDLVPDGYAYAGNNNTFYVDLVAGNTYSLRLMPMSETPKTHCVVSIKNHTHEDRWFISEDTDTVVYGCPCDEENYKFVGKLNRKKITVPSKAYNGGLPVTAVPKFVYSETEGTKEDINPACYTLTYYNSKGNKIDADKVKNIGKYSVDIKFCSATNSKDSLAGIKKISKLTFKVVPEGTTLKEVTPAKKSLKVKWDKQTTKTDGYQIQYSTNSKFDNVKTVTVSKNSTASKKISNLKGKRTYYVRIRTYKTVSKTKYYSVWSEAVKAKTK